MHCDARFQRGEVDTWEGRSVGVYGRQSGGFWVRGGDPSPPSFGGHFDYHNLGYFSCVTRFGRKKPIHGRQWGGGRGGTFGDVEGGEGGVAGEHGDPVVRLHEGADHRLRVWGEGALRDRGDTGPPAHREPYKSTMTPPPLLPQAAITPAARMTGVAIAGNPPTPPPNPTPLSFDSLERLRTGGPTGT